MLEIIPSINVENFEEAKKRIASVEKYVNWVHLDVSDGIFTKHVSWHDPRDLVVYDPKVKIEVHLMVDQPEREIDQWLQKAVSRVIFHQEATESHQLLIGKIRAAKKEAGVAIKPDTPWIKLFPYLMRADMVQLLAVNPGPSGQKFDEDTLHKLRHIRNLFPECVVEIDGGVNMEVAGLCRQAGASLLVAGSAIFGAMDIKKAIEELKK